MSHRYKNDNEATQTVVYCMREKCGLIKRAKHVSLILKGYVLAGEL